MLRWIPIAAMVVLVAMQGAGKAQDQNDMRTSLQSCINDAVTAGNFDKARMGTRGTLVVRCSDQPAQQMYMNLGRKVLERTLTLPNRDKATERKFGLSACYEVVQKADGSSAAEFSCRIAVSVGAVVLELF